MSIANERKDEEKKKDHASQQRQEDSSAQKQGRARERTIRGKTTRIRNTRTVSLDGDTKLPGLIVERVVVVVVEQGSKDRVPMHSWRQWLESNPFLVLERLGRLTELEVLVLDTGHALPALGGGAAAEAVVADLVDSRGEEGSGARWNGSVRGGRLVEGDEEEREVVLVWKASAEQRGDHSTGGLRRKEKTSQNEGIIEQAMHAAE